jgi:hypothetical protein
MFKILTYIIYDLVNSVSVNVCSKCVHEFHKWSMGICRAVNVGSWNQKFFFFLQNTPI